MPEAAGSLAAGAGSSLRSRWMRTRMAGARNGQWRTCRVCRIWTNTVWEVEALRSARCGQDGYTDVLTGMPRVVILVTHVVACVRERECQRARDNVYLSLRLALPRTLFAQVSHRVD